MINWIASITRDNSPPLAAFSIGFNSNPLLAENKIVAVLGGEHSTPLGLMEALNETGQSFGILQIDAHADLRDAYEGFEQSHASIMFNALRHCTNLKKLLSFR